MEIYLQVWIIMFSFVEQKKIIMTTEQMQQKLQEKQNQLATIVGEKEAQRLMDNALRLIKAGKKSILDVIS